MGRAQRGSVGRDVQAIRRSLGSISRALARLAPALAGATRGLGKAVRQRRKLKLSPARRAALELQGQYMGYLRNLKARQKALVKALRARKGVRAAVREAKRLAHARRG